MLYFYTVDKFSKCLVIIQSKNSHKFMKFLSVISTAFYISKAIKIHSLYLITSDMIYQSKIVTQSAFVPEIYVKRKIAKNCRRSRQKGIAFEACNLCKPR